MNSYEITFNTNRIHTTKVEDTSYFNLTDNYFRFYDENNELFYMVDKAYVLSIERCLPPVEPQDQPS